MAEGGIPLEAAQLGCEVLRPSALRAPEIDAWRSFIGSTPPLQRAFFSPVFALACEHAGARAHVAILHNSGQIQALLPFQFRSAWHERIRLAERIGGELCDAAGVITAAGFRTTPSVLMRLCGLGSMRITHLVPGQDELGLDAEWTRTCYLTDFRSGADIYFSGLATRNRDLVNDTKRRFKKAEKEYGALRFVQTVSPGSDIISAVVDAKRRQYARTKVPDPFSRKVYLALVHELARTAAPDCELLWTGLETDRGMIAQHLGLRCDDVLSYWFPVYDVDAKRVSPGRLLYWSTIEHASRCGIGIIDRGEGDAAFKQQLATESGKLGNASWSADNIWARAGHAWQAAEWRLDRMRRGATGGPPTFRSGVPPTSSHASA